MTFILHTFITFIIGGFIGIFITHWLQKKLMRARLKFEANKFAIEQVSKAISNLMIMNNECSWWLIDVKNQPDITTISLEHLAKLRQYRCGMHASTTIFRALHSPQKNSMDQLKMIDAQWRQDNLDKDSLNTAVDQLWASNRALQAHYETILSDNHLIGLSVK